MVALTDSRSSIPIRSNAHLSAFTLVELLIVMVLIGITFTMVLPTMGDSRELRLREAARLLAADIELAKHESITHADDLRLIKFDTINHRYWIGTRTDADTPITDVIGGGPFLVNFGTGRGSGAGGVIIQSLNLDGDNQLMFDAYGSPDQTTDATVTLACGTATVTVCVQFGSGEVSVFAP